MNKIALALAAALIGTAAYAQAPTSPSASGGSDKEKSAQASQPSSGGSQATPSRSEQGASQAQGRSESTTQGASSSQTQRSEQTTTRSRTGASVGIESREERGVSVRHRVRSVSEEPSVAIRRRRSVTIEDEPSEVRRTVIKRGKAAKKVAVKKRGKKVVVRGRRPVVAEGVSVTRRRSVRSVDVSEPSVSVSRRTTIRASERANVRSNVSVGERRGSTREQSQTSGTMERRGSAPETTGAVSGRTQSNAPAQGGSSSPGSSGGSSGGSGSSEKRADPSGSAKPGSSQ
jgi:hypothetical protein